MPPNSLLRRSRGALALAVTLAPLVAGCAQKGDFGRSQPGAWNTFLETAGTLAARERGEAAALYPFTDDEGELRDRAWRFLMPTSPLVAFTDILANLTRTRILPESWRPDSPQAFYETLMDRPFRSPVSRYHRLSDDIGADARLLPIFAATATRVIQADALRLRSIQFSRSLDDWDVRNAQMRVTENRCLIAWVRLETDLRIARYRFALEHLLIAVPSPEGALVERTLRALEARRPILDALVPPGSEDRCAFAGPAVEAVVALPPPPPARPIVAKY
ncbi:hypothetical protein [Methylobacterium gossipiicola]|uniref:Uncharacterized protein n=1 Tax=Methylobacterium gossipiicola TaxID=582675 RepID=A0A1I2WQJ6_9HYPH|nr:hypothetical protein [Methylobacterium gossipiicola]SFH02909.1 hypothetical protein SAMN05192565_12543 [Methylobacterium gossipiicola]